MDIIESFILKLKSKPISTNSAYYKRNRAFNDNSRTWRHNFFMELNSGYNQAQIASLRALFNPKKHMLRVCFTWYQPESIILTKSGELSLKSMDVDNLLKIPTDCVFDKKYNDKWLQLRKSTEAKLYSNLNNITNLQINDKFIFDTRSIKMPSIDDMFHCSISIEVVPLFKRSGSA